MANTPFTFGVTPAASAGAAPVVAPVAKPLVQLQFTTTAAFSAKHGVKMLVYGPAGSGKTTLCGTAPKPIILSAEAGLLSLRGKDIPVIVIKTVDDLEAALEWCRTNAKAQGIESICLDSISEITENILAAEKAKTKDPRAAYGEMATRTIGLIKQFRDLEGFHVLVTAKQGSQADAITGVVTKSPTAPGQMVGPALPYLFDIVLQAFTDKHPTTGATYHALRTHAAFNAEAKDRSGALDEVEYPDVTNMIQKIMAAETNPTQGA